MTDLLTSRTKRYALVVFRSLTIAVLVFCATMAAGIYITDHVLAKTYSATAVMEVQPQPPDSETYAGWAFSSPKSEAVEAEFESIESPQVLQAVIAKLSLDQVWAERLFQKSDPLTLEETMRHLASNLRLNFKHGTDIVEVRATSEDPKEAADIANAVVNFYQAVRDPQDDPAAKAPVRAVHILVRAAVPQEPSRPNKRVCFAITAGIAGLLSVMIASSVEVCLLIARAEETARELEPVS